MITAKDKSPQLTPEEYFAWEEQQLEKHEYIDGQVYAMGGRVINHDINHGRIAISLTSMLDAHMAEGDCITGNSDIKVDILGTNDYVYPDASVTCDERDQGTTKYITYPCLIVEVLSKSTEAYDRGGKFRMYRNNPVLQDYLLVSSTSIEIDLYQKQETGKWVILNYKEGDIVELRSINLNFPIAQIYRELALTPELS